MFNHHLSLSRNSRVRGLGVEVYCVWEFYGRNPAPRRPVHSGAVLLGAGKIALPCGTQEQKISASVFEVSELEVSEGHSVASRVDTYQSTGGARKDNATLGLGALQPLEIEVPGP